MSFLYRAEVELFDPPSNTRTQVHVFYECMPLDDLIDNLVSLLSHTWHVAPDHVFVRNILSEQMLMDMARGGDITSFARLFECDVRGDLRVSYIAPARTLLLVSPTALRRLRIGQDMAAMLAAAGLTATAKPAARPAADRPFEYRRMGQHFAVEFNGRLYPVRTPTVVPGDKLKVYPLDNDRVEIHRQYGGNWGLLAIVDPIDSLPWPGARKRWHTGGIASGPGPFTPGAPA